jgi:hypothetical protein
MESKSALFAKGTALRALMEARGIEFIDLPCSTKHIEWAHQNTETIDEYVKEQANGLPQ